MGYNLLEIALTFHREIPYNDLPDLPPKAETETVAILKMTIRANKAIAELRISGQLIPNQAVLIQTLGLSEAKSSSEIENIVTTNDELYRAFANGNIDIEPQTKEVLFYKDALWHGYHALTQKKRLLTTPLFVELAQILRNSTQGIRNLPGTKLVNPMGEIKYTPPEGEEIIRKKLSNLEKFIHADDFMDPLIKMAIMHYQFEAIHPFSDGNGRTGRILNILFLVEKQLLDIPLLYLSRYIISNKTAYYNGLQQVTEADAWEPWILYILQGLEQTAIATRERILAIHRLIQETAEKVRSQLPRIYSKDLIEVIFRSPYSKIKFLEESGIAKRQTASGYLKELEQIGVLRGLKIGRDIYYVNDAFLKALTKP
ncbi:MAG TPA: Fic family protein [Chlamydiales bacterium]|nr:Fic family protein [Chlamydiales bacterium]